MEPERAWVGPSLLGMSAYRTVRSGLSIEYGIGERKKFAQCLLIYLHHAVSIHQNCANPLCLLQFSGSSLRHAVTTLARLESSCSSEIYPAVGALVQQESWRRRRSPTLRPGFFFSGLRHRSQPEKGLRRARGLVVLRRSLGHGGLIDRLQIYIRHHPPTLRVH